MSEDVGGSPETVYQEISRALMEGQLRPGIPLRERQLAEIFNVSRGAIRKVLLRLGTEGKLEVIPNRGTFVPQPSSADVRRIYDARKAVESGLVGLLATRITDKQIAKLESHIAEQHRVMENPREKTVRLSGEFHAEVVRMIGSPELEEIVDRLVSRTQILVALFESPKDADCGANEHEEILDALRKRDSNMAAKAMLHHLSHVENRILSYIDRDETKDLQSIFRTAFGKRP